MVRDHQSGEVTSESRFMLKHTARLILANGEIPYPNWSRHEPSLAPLASFDRWRGRNTCLNFQPNALWFVKVSSERIARVPLGG
jgi:hypothetical protein